MRPVDLHVHSNKSDGSFTPSELVDLAFKKGLRAFALTDHDTIDGINEATGYAALLNKDKPDDEKLEVIPGIEFSTEYMGKDIHILGIYISYDSPSFLSYLNDFQDSRTLRNEKMCAKLREHGIDITYETLTTVFPDCVITRAHYARYLLDNGYVKSMPEAFDRYIGDHAPCFLPREKITPSDAVKLVLKSGGIPILAHPILYGMGNAALETLIKELKSVGLVGIEAIYSTYTPNDERKIREFAKKYDLLISGGSDFHGILKPNLDLGTGYGKLYIGDYVLAELKNYYHYDILFTDMDGTLLDDKKQVSAEVLTAMRNFTNSGGHIVLSSGRPLESILQVIDTLQIQVPNMYVIAFNGALVYDVTQKKALFEATLDHETVQTILNHAYEKNVYCHTYGVNEIISEKDTAALQKYLVHITLPYKIVDSIVDYLESKNVMPYKVLAVDTCDREKLLDFKQSLDPLVSDKVHTFFSNDLYLECCSKNAAKGSAMEFLCNYLGIPMSRTLAVGDAANDVSMLQTAAKGCAMANATSDAKLAADYITSRTNNEDGIIEVLDMRFGL